MDKLTTSAYRKLLFLPFIILWLAFCGSEALAARAFTPRFSTNIAGDIKIIGNTLLTCPAGGSCATAQAGGANNNNDYNMVFVNTAGGTTQGNRAMWGVDNRLIARVTGRD